MATPRTAVTSRSFAATALKPTMQRAAQLHLLAATAKEPIGQETRPALLRLKTGKFVIFNMNRKSPGLEQNTYTTHQLQVGVLLRK